MNPPGRAFSLATLLSLGLLAGCATQGLPDLPEAQSGTSLADRFTGLLDHRCPIPAEPALQPAEQREIRLIRSEWLLAVLTRYGNARIDDFSGDKQADAAMLLTRVEHALNVIRDARKDVLKDPNQFELYRADLILALLYTANSAIDPVLRVEKGFVLKPNPEDALQLLGNYFKDKLYAQAYGLACTDFMQAATQADKRAAVRQTVEAHLQDQCDKLARISGLANQCTAVTSE